MLKTLEWKHPNKCHGTISFLFTFFLHRIGAGFFAIDVFVIVLKLTDSCNECELQRARIQFSTILIIFGGKFGLIERLLYTFWTRLKRNQNMILIFNFSKKKKKIEKRKSVKPRNYDQFDECLCFIFAMMDNIFLDFFFLSIQRYIKLFWNFLNL